MNFGGLVATLLLSGLLLRLRTTRSDQGFAAGRTTRRGLGLVSLVLPIAGAALPFVPWRIMAALILIATVGGLILVLLLDGREAATNADPLLTGPTRPDRPAS